MINDSNLINKIIKQIENISFEELNYAIEIADKHFSNPFEIKVSYSNEISYTFENNLNNYNTIHIKTKKRFLDYFKKNNKPYNNENLEAA